MMCEQPVPGIGIDSQGEVPGTLAVVFKGRLGKTYPGTDTDRPSVSDKPAEIRCCPDGSALESRGSDTFVRAIEIEGSADIALRRSVGGTEEECGNNSEHCFKGEKTTLHLNNHWLGNESVNFSAKSIPASPARTGPIDGPTGTFGRGLAAIAGKWLQVHFVEGKTRFHGFSMPIVPARGPQATLSFP